MRFLPLKVHQVLDFIVGLALIFAPNIFGFSDVGGAAVAIPRIIGIASILMGLITDGYGFSIVKLIPIRIHLWADLVAGILLALSPWLFGFHDEKASAWVPHLVVGIALIIVSQVTMVPAMRAREA
jgi:uncharacterized membrane protein HdeD (DUF308 family)